MSGSRTSAAPPEDKGSRGIRGGDDADSRSARDTSTDRSPRDRRDRGEGGRSHKDRSRSRDDDQQSHDRRRDRRPREKTDIGDVDSGRRASASASASASGSTSPATSRLPERSEAASSPKDAAAATERSEAKRESAPASKGNEGNDDGAKPQSRGDSSSETAAAAFSSAFTQNVVKAMRTLYPEHHADSSFDNTGLLLEAPSNTSAELKDAVLLAIDLTSSVADEAIKRKVSIVVAYHTIIFRPLRSLTAQDTQQRTLLRLAAAGISVYCPHTAVDASPFGNADWLIDIATASPSPSPASAASRGQAIPKKPGLHLNHYQPAHDPGDNTEHGIELGKLDHDRDVIKPHPSPGVDTSREGRVGYGRIATLKQPRPLTEILQVLHTYLHIPASGIGLAVPQGKHISEIKVRSVATCAGSGGSVLLGLPPDRAADLWITGEVAHHEALYAIERGTCVVTIGHSNSERGYLATVLRPKLLAQLDKQGVKDAHAILSKEDRDPFGVFTIVHDEQ